MMRKNRRGKTPPRPQCRTCGPIDEQAWAVWKDCDPEWMGTKSNMPSAVLQLVHVAGDQEARGGRGRALKQCPTCGAFFEWVRSYEFLANGSEDEETYTRINAAKAEEWIGRDKAQRLQREVREKAEAGAPPRGLGTDAMGNFYDPDEEP